MKFPLKPNKQQIIQVNLLSTDYNAKMSEKIRNINQTNGFCLFSQSHKHPWARLKTARNKQTNITPEPPAKGRRKIICKLHTAVLQNGTENLTFPTVKANKSFPFDRGQKKKENK